MDFVFQYDGLCIEYDECRKLHLMACTDVHVKNVTVHGDERWPNNDGIDLDSCQHVVVEDSTIDTADDGVCIKGAAAETRNITVRRMRIRSRSSAIKFGSNCPMAMTDLLFEDVCKSSNRPLCRSNCIIWPASSILV